MKNLIVILFALSFQGFGQPLPWNKSRPAPEKASAVPPAPATKPRQAAGLPEAVAMLSRSLAENIPCDAVSAASMVIEISQAEGTKRQNEYQSKADEVGRRLASLDAFLRDREQFRESLVTDVARIQSELARVGKHLGQIDELVRVKQLAPDRLEPLRDSLKVEKELLQSQLTNRLEAQQHVADDARTLDTRMFREGLSKSYWALLVSSANSQKQLWNAAYVKVRNVMEYQCSLQRGVYGRCPDCEKGLGAPDASTKNIQKPGSETK